MTKRLFSEFEDTEKLNCWSNKNTLKLCGQETCTSCFKKSFASFDKDKVKCWSDKNTLKPIEVFKGSHARIIFKCNKCPHEFESVLKSLTGKDEHWCPFCANQKLCGQESCTYCFEKSFASFDDKNKLNCWSDKNMLKPIEVFKGSNKIYIFKCNKCQHEFESILSCVTGTNGTWCSFCCIPVKRVCGKESCTYCYDKTFSSFYDKDKVKCWSDKNRLKPIQVAKSSGKKIIFNCNICNREFESTLSGVTGKGTWCKFCYASKNKFIRKLFKIFDKMSMKYNVESQVKCGGRLLRWDMVVYNNKQEFYIESDGEQHFSVKGLVAFTHVKIPNEEERKFKDQRDRDLLKEKYIIDNNKLLYGISYRQFDQLEELVQEMISKSEKNYKGVVKMDDIYNW